MSSFWLYPDRYGRSVCEACDTVSHASIADHLAERHPQVHAECGQPFGPPWHDNREPGRTLPFGCEAVAS